MKPWVLEHWAKAASVVATVVSVVALLGVLVFALPAYKKTQDQARQGEKAQARLVRIAPVSCKNYMDQLSRGVITARDFQLVITGLATQCPPR